MECHNCARDFTDGGIKNNKFCSAVCANTYFQKKSQNEIKINKDKFKELTEEHNKAIKWIEDNMLVRSFTDRQPEQNEFFEELKKKTKLICLINSGCQCERCGTKDNLTVHHIFTRRVKSFMTFNRYMTQRYYWKNIIVLCIDCHTDYHKNEKDWDEELKPIEKYTLNKLRRDYLNG